MNRRKLTRTFRRIGRMRPSIDLGRMLRTARRLGWKLIVVVIALVIVAEVLVGIMQGAYTRDQYRFLLVPLPLFALVVVGINYALNTLRKRLYAGFFLSLFIALVETGMTLGVIYIIVTRFAFPQVTTYLLLLYATYLVWQAWRRGVFGKRLRRPQNAAHAGHGH